MSIQQNLAGISSILPPAVKLVAVSKNRPASDILEAYDSGQRRFGENKVQELTAKQPVLPKDIEWHFIGHLQKNKVRFIVPFVHCIHSIDSLKLLLEVNGEAKKANRIVNCLLELHIAEEETKFGLDLPGAKALLESEEYRVMEHVRITGLMGMGTFTSDTEIVRKEFRALRHYFKVLKQDYFSGNDKFMEISMGMSDDFRIAIEEGSTMVRIGTAIFGSRDQDEIVS